MTLAVDVDLARVGAVDARDALDERRLACAVVADEPEHLAGEELQVDAAQRLHGAVRLLEAAQPRTRRASVTRGIDRPRRLRQLVHHHGSNDDAADDDLLPEIGHVHEHRARC